MAREDPGSADDADRTAPPPRRSVLSVAPSDAMDLPSIRRRELSIGARGRGRARREYQLVACIAKGGMGEVFLARMSQPGHPPKRVIVKRLLEELRSDTEHVQMFKSEAEVMHRLDHPNIVKIIDDPTIDDTPCLAMEYVHGRSVGAILGRSATRRQPLPIPMVLHIMSRVLHGLGHVHDARLEDGAPLQLVHRDITPGNLLVSFDGEVKITDFGISKSQMSRVSTTVGIVKGKARYLAPEQILGEPATPRSDLFSCACVVIEMITGEPLFERVTVPKTLYAIVHGERPELSDLIPIREPALVQTLERALSTDPKRRQASAWELAEDLEDVLGQLGESPTSPALGAWLRRLFEGAEEPWETPGLEPVPIDANGRMVFDGPAAAAAAVSAPEPRWPGDIASDTETELPDPSALPGAVPRGQTDESTTSGEGFALPEDGATAPVPGERRAAPVAEAIDGTTTFAGAAASAIVAPEAPVVAPIDGREGTDQVHEDDDATLALRQGSAPETPRRRSSPESARPRSSPESARARSAAPPERRVKVVAVEVDSRAALAGLPDSTQVLAHREGAPASAEVRDATDDSIATRVDPPSRPPAPPVEVSSPALEGRRSEPSPDPAEARDTRQVRARSIPPPEPGGRRERAPIRRAPTLRERITAPLVGNGPAMFVMFALGTLTGVGATLLVQSGPPGLESTGAERIEASVRRVRRKTPPPAGSPSTLDIIGPPGATLWLDGEAIEAPAPVFGLQPSPGVHRVEIQVEDARRAVTVELAAGEHDILEFRRRAEPSRGPGP